MRVQTVQCDQFIIVTCTLCSIEFKELQFPAARNANDPYWAEIWASALAVAQVIAADSSLVKGKIVAELGSGLGVAGLFAAKQGSFLAGILL